MSSTARSLEQQAGAVKDALRDPSTCSSLTVRALDELLSPTKSVPTTQRPFKPTKKIQSKSRLKSATTAQDAGAKSKLKVLEDQEPRSASLSTTERYILATEVINITLKVLTEAIKNPRRLKRASSSREVPQLERSSSFNRNLSRSPSAPQLPLQPQSFNRVSNSPAESLKMKREPPSNALLRTDLANIIACSQLGFAHLRLAQVTEGGAKSMPYLQLEAGMSALVGKLISLGYQDKALKELRILKRRLGGEPVKLHTADKKMRKVGDQDTGSDKETLAGLLLFGDVEIPEAAIGLVIQTQLHALKIIASSGKPSVVEEAVRYLDVTLPNSPTDLLVKSASRPQSVAKAVQQLQVLSHQIFSLCPSLSTTEDYASVDRKTSVAPEVAIRLQILGLEVRVIWWMLADHQADVDRELLEILSKCLRTFYRRSSISQKEKVALASDLYDNLSRTAANFKFDKVGQKRLKNFSICKQFASMAQQAHLHEEAASWWEEALGFLSSSEISDAPMCSCLARLASSRLRSQELSYPISKLESALTDVIRGLEGSLRGDLIELDELSVDAAMLRKVAAGHLMKQMAPAISSNEANKFEVTNLNKLCFDAVIASIRFQTRYLGSKPGANDGAKALLQYEQRRAVTRTWISNAVEPTVCLLRALVSSDAIELGQIDSVSRDCSFLVDAVNEPDEHPQDHYPNPKAFYVMASNIYWLYYLKKKQGNPDAEAKSSIHCLRRAVEFLMGRPSAEQEAGLIATKSEKLAGALSSYGKTEEAMDYYRRAIAFYANGEIMENVVECATHSSIAKIRQAVPKIAALERSIAAYTRLVSKSATEDSSKKMILNDLEISHDRRGLLLELQFESLQEMYYAKPSRTSYAEAIAHCCHELLKIYTPSRYPIRRLRSLVRALRLSDDATRTLDGSHLAELVEELDISATSDQGLDAGLYGYRRHLSISASICVALRQVSIPFGDVERCLNEWVSIIGKDDLWDSLLDKVDDVNGFVPLMRSIAEFLAVQGKDQLRLSLLSLVARFNDIEQSQICKDAGFDMIQLALQYLRLGYSGRAGLILAKIEGSCKEPSQKDELRLRWDLAYAEYLISISNMEKRDESLESASRSVAQLYEAGNRKTLSSTLHDRARANEMVAEMSYLYSLSAFENGRVEDALSCAKQSVRYHYRAWACLENRPILKATVTEPEDSRMDTDTTVETFLKASTNELPHPVMSMTHELLNGPKFWSLALSLHRSLMLLSRVYSDHGFSREAVHYAGKALIIAEAVRSDILAADSLAVIGDYRVRSGDMEEGKLRLDRAKYLDIEAATSKDVVGLHCAFGNLFKLQKDWSNEISSYRKAEEILAKLREPSYITNLESISSSSTGLEVALGDLSLSEKVATKPKTTGSRTNRTGATKRGKGAISKPKKEVTVQQSPAAVECVQLSKLHGNILRFKAAALSRQKRAIDAEVCLQEAEILPRSQNGLVQQRLVVAKNCYRQAIANMNKDQVFRVVQESTISFPSIAGTSRQYERYHSGVGGHLSLSPPQKPPSKPLSQRSAQPRTPAKEDIAAILDHAREQISQVITLAMRACSTPTIHSLSKNLGSIILLLSSVNAGKTVEGLHPSFAVFALEVASIVSMKREKFVMKQEKMLGTSKTSFNWPDQANGRATPERSNRAIVEYSRFQHDYIDIIPSKWAVLSISLNENCDELVISKIQAGQVPFILRLPLSRHNSRDMDEDVFGFEQGKQELLEILELANRSAHDASDMTMKGAKTAWWKQREDLDNRLKDLLLNIEKVWLGGFRGIFSGHRRKTNLLARFQRSFLNILDTHLPSRQKTKGRTKAPRTTLDSRILELFIGLGDPAAADMELDEPLTDLLYFVVDILQFHGERNAYDEIDLDSIIVEVQDALKSYHEAARAQAKDAADTHTILILDKALHGFPWESLPCLEGQSVSRLPSLACLRDRILAQQQESHDDRDSDRFYIDRTSGASILNPSGDLLATQRAFESPFMSQLTSWNHMVNRAPSEEEFSDALSTSSLFLYFGHGSGSQYIRGRTVKRLDKCAVTMLMGCSSGTLTEVGEYEPYGTPRDYMVAGCPALVATLWDVTDKDIDAFANGVFEKWGLLGKAAAEQPVPKTPGRGRARSKATTTAPAESERRGEESLCEAVARSRERCRMRYLNGAAPVVYGIPVYLK
ncbi:MAG: hypothetical protein M1824_002611 [Vezdaea acicularis]|nr:MAG: hypothetical protein M1824_002611 [Vezdaea acicularis]